MRHVSRDLGVRYVLEGSVRKAGDQLRIIAQLIDASTGNHIWSERYDGDHADIFDLQDRVTEAIVGAIEPTITLSEIERAKRKRPDSLDAYDCVMRALPTIWSHDAEAIAEGLRLAEHAIALDPTYALPKALAAWCYAQGVTYMRTPCPVEDRAKAIKLAQEAASLDSNDPLVLTVLSGAYVLGGHLILQSLVVDTQVAVVEVQPLDLLFQSIDLAGQIRDQEAQGLLGQRLGGIRRRRRHASVESQIPIVGPPKCPACPLPRLACSHPDPRKGWDFPQAFVKRDRMRGGVAHDFQRVIVSVNLPAGHGYPFDIRGRQIQRALNQQAFRA